MKKRILLLSVLVLGASLYAESEEQGVAAGNVGVADTVSVVEQAELAAELVVANVIQSDSETKTEVSTAKCPCTRPTNRPRRTQGPNPRKPRAKKAQQA